MIVSASRTRPLTRLIPWLLTLAVAFSACQSSRNDAPGATPVALASAEEARQGSPAPSEYAGRSLPIAGMHPVEGNQLAANDAVASDSKSKDEEEDEGEKYWAGVKFGLEQFDEVLEYVQQEYIEEKIDTQLAYVSAANFALSMLDPPYEVVPTAYYKAHKDDPEIEFDSEDRDELTRSRRDLFQKRYDELQGEWDKFKFTREEFLEVMAWASTKATQQKKPVKEQRLWLAASQGFLYALDPHSSLVSKKAWEESTRETQDASFDGIGALLTQRFEPSRTLKNRLKGVTAQLDKEEDFLFVELGDDAKLKRRTFVESPMPGQPAETAGLWAGDEIVKVDGESVVDVPLDKVVGHIRGKKGTTVTLTVLREGEPGELSIPVVRSHIRVTNVEGRILESYPCMGYVKLTGFIESSFTDLKDEVERLNGQCEGGIRGLIFDLRGNSGGLLSQGVRIADYFISKGRIVTVKNRRKSLFSFASPGDEVYNAHREGTVALPMVVLVNDGAASASEIVASALQDNERAIVVGERTFGKASVQTLINPTQSDGYYIKLTIARYFSPSGRTLQVTGVQPDVEVPPEVDGKMPVGFREEDLSNHLSKIDSDYVSPNKAWTQSLTDCVKRRGIAKQIFKDNPHPQVKFDYQLYSGADYLECIIEGAEQAGKRPDSLYLSDE